MEVTIEDKYKVHWSADQWVVSVKADQSHPKAKQDEERWRPVSYHNRLSHAADWLWQQMVGERDPEILQAAVTINKVLTEAVEKLIQQGETK